MANILNNNPAIIFMNNAASVSKTFGTICKNPSLIVAVFTVEVENTTATITDNGNAGPYSIDATASTGFAVIGYGTVFIASMQNTSSADLTVTATPATSNYGYLKIFELIDLEWVVSHKPIGGVDATGTGASATGLTEIAVPITTHTADCSIFLGLIYYDGRFPPGAVVFADPGYTGDSPQAGNYSYHFYEYELDAGAVGSVTLNCGGGKPTNQWQAAAVAYKPSATPPPPSGSAVDFPQGIWVMGRLTATMPPT